MKTQTDNNQPTYTELSSSCLVCKYDIFFKVSKVQEGHLIIFLNFIGKDSNVFD